MGRNVFETIMGAVVLVVAGFFVSIAYKSGQVSAKNGYTLSAKFDNIGSLAIGSDVRVSGIKVGTVTDQKIDTETFYAVIKVSIDDEIKLPEDSSAQIASDGLLGGNYLSIVPGGAMENLASGGEIKYTQSAIDMMGLIAKTAFGSADSGDSKKDDDSL